MFDFFERLRKKTRRERQTFALVSSLSITVLIFGLWAVLSLPRNFDSVAEEDSFRSEELSKTEKKTISPMENLKRGFQNAVASVKEEFSSLADKLAPSFEQQFTAPSSGYKDFKEAEKNDINEDQ